MKKTALPFPIKQSWALLLALLFCTLPFSQATASTAAPIPMVSISLGNGLFQTIYFTVGAPLLAEVRVTVPMPLPLPVDVYVGARLPNGAFASWVQGADKETTLITQSTPIPFMKSFLLETDVNWDFRYTFSGPEPAGIYLAYVVLVLPGKDPLDVRNWIAVSTAPFAFSP